MSYQSGQSYQSDVSDPFGPPGHQPPPVPPPAAQQPQSWAPVGQPGYAAAGAPPAPHQPFGPAPKGGNGLAVAAVVMSGLALLGVLAIAAFIAVGVASGGGGALSGAVTVVDKGASYSDLQRSITAAIEDDGGSVDEVVCPERSQVGQGLVTVCHGSVDGFDWTGVVVFEDDEGTFTLTPY